MKFSLVDQARIDTWAFNKNLEESTLKTYLKILNKFCDINNLSPAELILEADSEEDKGIKLRDRKINIHFIKFKKQLIEEGKAENTINLYINAIKSFYFALDIQLPKIKTSRGDICLEKNYGKLISREELLKLINVAPSRERALIYLMALSGMSQKEARQLRLETFFDAAGKAINKEINSVLDLFEYEEMILNEVLTLEIVRTKVNYRYITFIPPEATIQIINYLRERMFGRNQKIRVKSIKLPIFVKNNGEPADCDIIVTNFRRLGLMAGFKKKEGAYSFWRAHSLRKYFISTIINEIRYKDEANFMAGHTISNVDRAYWFVNPKKLKEIYLKALPFLSIDNAKVIDVKTDDVKRIEELEHVQADMKESMLKTMPIFEALKNNPDIMEALNNRMNENRK